MRFAVVGTGGVGGYFGGKLARNGEDVWFVARGAHLEAMRKIGLRIKSTEGNYSIPPGTMTDRMEDIGPVDVILFCVKAYDTDHTLQSLSPLLKDGTVIISLQNGIDNEEKIGQALPGIPVYGGVVYIYSTVSAPGEVTETGGPKTLIFGPLPPGGKTALPGEILDRMIRAGIKASLSDHIVMELWRKFIFIAAVGGLTAMTRLPLGEILAVDETSRLLRAAMTEADALGRAVKAGVDPAFIDHVFATLKRVDTKTYSSMYHDLMHGKPLEIEAFSGSVVRLGTRFGISTPVHNVIYAALLPHHLRHVKDKA